MEKAEDKQIIYASLGAIMYEKTNRTTRNRPIAMLMSQKIAKQRHESVPTVQKLQPAQLKFERTCSIAEINRRAGLQAWRVTGANTRKENDEA